MDLVGFILHIDEHLANIITLFGPWTYVVIFGIIFAETGFVVTPFLPGDSLLFAVGALAGGGYLNVWTVYITLILAAILGDTINYWIGYRTGPKIFLKENARIFNKANLEKTRAFYEKHGGKTIIMARFLPIIRSFAPFVAGVGKMNYSTFLFYNVIGAFVWVISLVSAGYFFGGYPLIKENFEYAVIGIILISVIPMIIEYVKHKTKPQQTKQPVEKITYKDLTETFKKEHLSE